MVKASFFYCEMPMVTRGIETRLQILSSKEVHMVRRDGCNHVRDSIWRRHLPIFYRNQVANLVLKRSPYCTSRWFQSGPRFYMVPASANIFLKGQDGRVVKASFFCEIAMVTRGFETRLQILPSKEVHIVRRDGFNHVRDSIWRRHLPIF